MTRDQRAINDDARLSVAKYLATGAFGFCLASLGVFATVAFAERWMYDHLGLTGAYVVWTSLFILLGGGVLSPLVVGHRLAWFYVLFTFAFLAYAAGWTGAYFTLGGAAGEWAGSFAGSVLMGAVIAAGFRTFRFAPSLCASLFVANSIGYFTGSALNDSIGGKAGMLLWGVVYGLALGAGLGASLYIAQRRPSDR
ncbi:MAG: hypothetical protein AB1631_29475 [Acidobacteriota bacterium]